MGIADEQPASGLVLKFSDVLADGRLAQAESLSGPGETPGLGNGQESLKQDGIQHGSIITIFDYNNSYMRHSQ
jgi:hypothetical protein